MQNNASQDRWVKIRVWEQDILSSRRSIPGQEELEQEHPGSQEYHYIVSCENTKQQHAKLAYNSSVRTFNQKCMKLSGHVAKINNLITAISFINYLIISIQTISTSAARRYERSQGSYYIIECIHPYLASRLTVAPRVQWRRVTGHSMFSLTSILVHLFLSQKVNILEKESVMVLQPN